MLKKIDVIKQSPAKLKITFAISRSMIKRTKSKLMMKGNDQCNGSRNAANIDRPEEWQSTPSIEQVNASDALSAEKRSLNAGGAQLGCSQCDSSGLCEYADKDESSQKDRLTCTDPQTKYLNLFKISSRNFRESRRHHRACWVVTAKSTLAIAETTTPRRLQPSY